MKNGYVDIQAVSSPVQTSLNTSRVNSHQKGDTVDKCEQAASSTPLMQVSSVWLKEGRGFPRGWKKALRTSRGGL